MEQTEGFNHSKQLILERFRRNRFKQLSELRNENEFCDLTLKSGDGFEIKVHKFIISSASNYFKDLLTTPMKEKTDECITLPGITEDVLIKIITFIYTSEFEEKIEDVENIIKSAVIFQLEELVEICSLVLSESISDHTCLKYWRLARDNLVYGLENNCLAFIASRAGYLFENSFLNDLTIEEMKSLLIEDSLHLQNPEQAIFEHVWNWAAGKVSQTNKFSEVFSEVVTLLRFSKMKNEFVFQKIFDNEDVLANEELLNKVSKLIKIKHTENLQKKVKDETITRHILPKKKLLGLAANKMFTGLEEGNTTVQIQKELRKNFSHTTFDTNFLLISGGQQSSNCEYLDPITQEWKEFPSMKMERSSHACLYTIDNKIYACGGAESKSVEVFDFGKEEWYHGPEMISNGVNFGLAAANGAIYAFKGERTVEIFDPQSAQWKTVTFQNQYYQQHLLYTHCVANSPYIYCFSKGIRHKYDTRSNQMVEQVSCMDFNNVFSVCEMGSCFYGFGYKQQSDDKYLLKFVQNQLTGARIYTETIGMHYIKELNKTALVALYY